MRPAAPSEGGRYAGISVGISAGKPRTRRYMHDDASQPDINKSVGQRHITEGQRVGEANQCHAARQLSLLPPPPHARTTRTHLPRIAGASEEQHEDPRHPHEVEDAVLEEQATLDGNL